MWVYIVYCQIKKVKIYFSWTWSTIITTVYNISSRLNSISTLPWTTAEWSNSSKMVVILVFQFFCGLKWNYTSSSLSTKLYHSPWPGLFLIAKYFVPPKLKGIYTILSIIIFSFYVEDTKVSVSIKKN